MAGLSPPLTFQVVAEDQGDFFTSQMVGWGYQKAIANGYNTVFVHPSPPGDKAGSLQ